MDYLSKLTLIFTLKSVLGVIHVKYIDHEELSWINERIYKKHTLYLYIEP